MPASTTDALAAACPTVDADGDPVTGAGTIMSLSGEMATLITALNTLHGALGGDSAAGGHPLPVHLVVVKVGG